MPWLGPEEIDEEIHLPKVKPSFILNSPKQRIGTSYPKNYRLMACILDLLKQIIFNVKIFYFLHIGLYQLFFSHGADLFLQYK